MAVLGVQVSHVVAPISPAVEFVDAAKGFGRATPSTMASWLTATPTGMISRGVSFSLSSDVGGC